MPRGSKTPPKKAERAIALAAKLNNQAAAARELELSRSTVNDLVQNSDKFEQFRTEMQRTFIVRAWKPTMRMVDLLEKRLEMLTDKDLLLGSVRDLTGAIRDLRTSMENVGTVINDNRTQTINYNMQSVHEDAKLFVLANPDLVRGWLEEAK